MSNEIKNKSAQSLFHGSLLQGGVRHIGCFVLLQFQPHITTNEETQLLPKPGPTLELFFRFHFAF